jgi:hypothetical protein
MKKHLFILAMLLLVAHAASSQTPYRQFGVKAGVNIASADYVPGTIATPMNAGAIAGGNFSFTFDRVLLRFITLGFELNYVNRGYSLPITFTDVNGVPLGQTDITYRLNYAAIPLKVGFQFGKKHYFFGNAAIVPAILTKAISEVKADPSMGLVGGTSNIYADAQQYGLSKQVELGAGITPLRNMKFYFSISKQFAMTNFYDNSTSQAFNFKPNDLAFNVGMKLEFGKGLLR